jgi:hypothetical protein
MTYDLNEVLSWFEYSYDKNSLIDRSLYESYEVITALYNKECYEGDVFVLLKKGDLYYEVHGSHCSCYGLEGQFEPEVTTAESLKHRIDSGQPYGAFKDCIPEIKEHFGW